MILFLAAAPTPIVLADTAALPNRAFRFSFNNTPGLNFEVLTAPDVAMLADLWTERGKAKEVFAGNYEFTDDAASNSLRMFYRVRF
jgi:hypothetical protein